MAGFAGPPCRPGSGAGVAERTLWVSEASVTSVLDLAEAVDVLAEAFRAEGAGDVLPLDKTTMGFAGHATLHALGAASPRFAAVKAWAHTPGGADPALLLFDAASGSLVAVIEAFALGQMRTAGTAALATDRLARRSAASLAVIGTGKQALPQVAAVAAVRDLREVRAWSPSEERREAFARRVEERLGLECRAAAGPAEAVAGADVVTLVTRATEPVLTDGLVRPGVHINAVGAIDLERTEFEPGILGRASLVVTDSMSQARSLSSELRAFYDPSPPGWGAVRTLGEVVHGEIRRGDDSEITLFKGMGSGVEDLALGTAVLERVQAAGGAPAITRTGRAQPRLAASTARKWGGDTL